MLGEKATFAQLVGPPCALTSSGGKVPVQAAKQKKHQPSPISNRP
jgi:hypothetical protein